jgi:hypothetical protein
MVALDPALDAVLRAADPYATVTKQSLGLCLDKGRVLVPG